ncbi:MAG TPA: flavodoxin family protein [Pelolinea sp.]|nr:flavodoxin family protein [Pelolinea sp.]
MKILVVYDSVYGNTKKLAETVAETLNKSAKVVSVDEYKSDDLKGVELLVVGSPILGWRPSEKTGKFLSSLQPGQIKGVKAAAFDSRIKLFIHGDAAGKIALALSAAGAEIVGEPAGFFVKSAKGPLAKGEEARAAEWAKTLLA